MLFGKYSLQLSEIFWEVFEHMLNARLHLSPRTMNQGFIVDKAEMYVQSVHKKFQDLPDCVVFTNGTVIGIERPKGNLIQRVD